MFVWTYVNCNQMTSTEDFLLTYDYDYDKKHNHKLYNSYSEALSELLDKMASVSDQVATIV